MATTECELRTCRRCEHDFVVDRPRARYCAECVVEARRESRRAYKKRNPEKTRAAWMKAYYADPEKYRSHPGRVNNRAQHLRRTYNITLEEYETLLKSQDGHCAFPGCDSTYLLAVDHDHACCAGRKSCGECVRAILCQKHNVFIRTEEDHLLALQYLRGSDGNHD